MSCATHQMHGMSKMKSFVCMQSSSSKLRTNDQYLSLTDQLNLGVRAVELDTHWVEVSNQSSPESCHHCSHLKSAVLSRILGCSP